MSRILKIENNNSKFDMYPRLLLLIAVLWATAWARTAPAQTAPDKLDAYELIFPAMGTQMALQCYSDDEQLVHVGFAAAQKEVEHLVEILSDYSTESETVLLSADDKIGHWQQVSPELFEALEVCDQWHQLSGGAFDASVGQLSILWRKARKAKTIPTAEQIDTARSRCGWQHVHLDRQSHQVRIDLKGLRLDFGAMGKGYIIDKAYETLVAGGLPCSLVRAGGDLRLGTAPPGKAGWPVEIARLSPTEEATQLYLAECAISSSGDLYQFMEVDGVRRSHVLDPRTGIGVPGPRLVTVIANSSTQADAADTAMCVMRDEAALKVAEQIDSLKVRMVTVQSTANQTNQLHINTTPNFDRLIQPK